MVADGPDPCQAAVFFMSRQSRNVPLESKVETSPCRCSKSSHSLFSEKRRSACGGFSQGRAPILRAPEGSLDGFRCKQHNGAVGNGSDLSETKGTFLLCQKGTFLFCCHSGSLFQLFQLANVTIFAERTTSLHLKHPTPRIRRRAAAKSPLVLAGQWCLELQWLAAGLASSCAGAAAGASGMALCCSLTPL